MSKKVLESEETKQVIAKALVGGESQAKIARSFDVHQSTISRFSKREDVRKFIDEQNIRLLEAVPDAVGNVVGMVKGMKDIPPQDTRRLELSYKASSDVLKAAGLMPTPVQSQVIQNIYNDNRGFQLSPILLAVLEEYGKTFRSEPDQSQ